MISYKSAPVKCTNRTFNAIIKACIKYLQYSKPRKIQGGAMITVGSSLIMYLKNQKHKIVLEEHLKSACEL